MHDAECIAFLQWALPRMGFRWLGFRRVRGQVCKRIGRRLRELTLDDLQSYQEHLQGHPDEWEVLDSLCRITISRFFRDRGVWEKLGSEVLPELARRCASTGAPAIHIWSAGCGAGEEPYSIAILHRESGDTDLRRAMLRILATDSDSHQLERARTAVYPVGCTKDMPSKVRTTAFEELNNRQVLLNEPYRRDIEWACQDLRRQMPDGLFDLILCRNLAFTYFIEETQREILIDLHQRLRPGGYLVIGTHEQLPASGSSFEPLPHCTSILRRDSQDRHHSEGSRLPVG